MSSLKQRWNQLQEDVYKHTVLCGRNPNEISIIGVSKTHPYETIIEGLESGINHFGENYAQEFRDKFTQISALSIYNPTWHFIGHLQTNKVKYIVPSCSYIHTVDSIRLAEEIGKLSVKNNVKTHILLQINTSGETSKSGITPENIYELTDSVKNIQGIIIDGLMCIPTPDDETAIRMEFRQLYQLRQNLLQRYPEHPWHHLSMGMTSDYHIAIEEGATMIRIGTAIFGQR